MNGTAPIAGLVLAAGSSKRLGQPKQLLAFRGATLLDATLNRVRDFDLDQRIVAIGGSSREVQEQVDLDGFDVVTNEAHGSGCSSSIVAALSSLADGTAGFLLFLGDQPDVEQTAIDSLLDAATPDSMALCRYHDGLGHPFWFGRDLFADLAELHGDKAVWKIKDSGVWPVTEVDVDGSMPLDVDTWEDYERLLARASS